MTYGRKSYDFEEGVMMFIAPGQVISPHISEVDEENQGWTILFHPDLIRGSHLATKIGDYRFFSYEVDEALHLSDQEKQTLTELAEKIKREISQGIDKHTKNLISGNIELLLDYCVRYYDRQFFTRSSASSDLVCAFEKLLREYYQGHDVIESGIPTVAYCGKKLGLSPYYLSDLLKKETGKSAKEHIQFFLIEKAKNQLLGTSLSISQIAYELGFDYPAHFTKLFKSKTGINPSEYRRSH